MFTSFTFTFILSVILCSISINSLSTTGYTTGTCQNSRRAKCLEYKVMQNNSNYELRQYKTFRYLYYTVQFDNKFKRNSAKFGKLIGKYLRSNGIKQKRSNPFVIEIPNNSTFTYIFPLTNSTGSFPPPSTGSVKLSTVGMNIGTVYTKTTTHHLYQRHRRFPNINAVVTEANEFRRSLGSGKVNVNGSFFMAFTRQGKEIWIKGN